MSSADRLVVVPDLPDPTVDAVHLRLPAEARYIRLARLTAAGLAGDLGYGVADIEDLRIAVDEACAVLVDAPDPRSATIALVYRVEGRDVTIEGSRGATGGTPAVHPVACELLRMSTDEFTIEARGGSWHFRLVKRPSTA